MLVQEWRTKSRSEVKKSIDVPVIPNIPEVIPEKKPEVGQIVDTKPKVKRKRQKLSQSEIVMTEFGKTVIKKARGNTIRLTSADMQAVAIYNEVWDGRKCETCNAPHVQAFVAACVYSTKDKDVF